MSLRPLKLAICICFVFGLAACSSSKGNVQTIDPVASAAPSEKVPSHRQAFIDSASLVRLEIAHGSFLRALALESQSEYQLAEQFMRHAYESDPSSRFLAFSLVELMEMRGASAEALKLAETAKKLKGVETSSQCALLGRLYSESSNLDSALVYYKKAVDSNDQNLRAAYEYALLLEIAHDYDELMKVYATLLPQIGFPQSMMDRELSLLNAAGKDSVMAELLLSAYESNGDAKYLTEHSKLLFKMKKYEDVLLDVERMKVDSLNDSIAMTFMMSAFVELGRNTEALDSLRARYSRGPKDSYILMKIALLETKLNDRDKAKSDWNKLKDDPEFGADANAMLSSYYWEEGDSLNSLKYMEKAYSLAPSRYGENMATRYASEGRYKKAYAVLDFLLKDRAALDSLAEASKLRENVDLDKVSKVRRSIAFQMAEFHYIYGYVQLVNAEALERVPTTKAKLDSAFAIRGKAESHFESSIKLGGETLNLLFSMGANLLALGKVDSSIVVFKKLFAQDPKDAMALNHLGYFLVDLNRNSKEMEWGASLIDSALKLDSANVAYLDSKGWALYRKGQFEEALKVMEEVEKKAVGVEGMLNQDTSVYSHLAAICDALSLSSRAMNYYKKVLAIDPQNVLAKERTKALEASGKAN